MAEPDWQNRQTEVAVDMPRLPLLDDRHVAVDDLLPGNPKCGGSRAVGLDLGTRAPGVLAGTISTAEQGSWRPVQRAKVDRATTPMVDVIAAMSNRPARADS